MIYRNHIISRRLPLRDSQMRVKAKHLFLPDRLLHDAFACPTHTVAERRLKFNFLLLFPGVTCPACRPRLLPCASRWITRSFARSAAAQRKEETITLANSIKFLPCLTPYTQYELQFMRKADPHSLSLSLPLPLLLAIHFRV